MTKTNWYPLAISALVLGCGGTTEDGHGANAGGSSSIDSGVPTNTGGAPTNYYGVRFDTGGMAAQQTATGGAGGASGVNTGFGGVITMYGPRFDKPMQSKVASGGGPSCLPSDTEGGAAQTPVGAKCVTRDLE